MMTDYQKKVLAAAICTILKNQILLLSTLPIFLRNAGNEAIDDIKDTINLMREAFDLT